MTNYLHKLTMLDDEINHPLIHGQVEEIKQIDHYVGNGKPLKAAPDKLGLLPDQFEDVLKKENNLQEELECLFKNAPLPAPGRGSCGRRG